MALCGPDGELVASFGDIDRPFFIRSAAKPFQAYVSQAAGADLERVELAVASASHRGHPVQVAIVEQILSRAGLTRDALGCPKDWPLSSSAALRLASAGERDPRAVWHNCSGKHAAFLAACAAQSWPTASYMDPDHPLHQRVGETIAELGRWDPGAPGIDGCGAPVFRTTARALARLYSRLASDTRLAEVRDVMHAYPALIGENGAGDSEIGVAIDGVAKGGALGCLGVAVSGGLGIGVKSWDGLGDVAVTGAVAALEQIGRLGGNMAEVLGDIGRPPSLGGGRPVGKLEPRFSLGME